MRRAAPKRLIELAGRLISLEMTKSDAVIQALCTAGEAPMNR